MPILGVGFGVVEQIFTIVFKDHWVSGIIKIPEKGIGRVAFPVKKVRALGKINHRIQMPASACIKHIINSILLNDMRSPEVGFAQLFVNFQGWGMFLPGNLKKPGRAGMGKLMFCPGRRNDCLPVSNPEQMIATILSLNNAVVIDIPAGLLSC